MDILMPQLGETVAEGKITTWYKSIGDRVAAGDALFEIETDKTSMEVPTTEAGVLSEIRVAAGATVPVGSIVAVISSESRAMAGATNPAKAAAYQRTGAPAAAAGTTTSTAGGSGTAPAARRSARAFDPANPVHTPLQHYGPATLPGGVKVTPVARRLAAEGGVDLGSLKGSGPHGHIIARDVQSARARAGMSPRGNGAASAATSDVAPAAASAAAAAGAPAALSSRQIKALYAGIAFEEVPLDGMRRTVARRLTEAKQSIPHFYLSADVSLDKLLAMRAELNAQGEGQLKVSINDLIIRAVALALQRVPQANAVWAEESILRFKRADVAVAVAVEGGLFTPVIRDAAAKSISDLSREMKGLAASAQARTLKPADYSGGSITISNLGMFGVREFAAIVNPPQAAILAVGAAERRPMEGPDGAVRFGSVMTLTLSCDHRVIDGALGARLLGAIKTLLESPLLLLV